MRNIIKLLLPLAAVFSASLLAHAEGQGKTWPLPALADADSWQAANPGGKTFSFSSGDDVLSVDFDCSGGNAAELRLKTPVPMADEADGFTFLCGNNGVPSGLQINVILKDADGKEFYFYTSSWFSFKKGLFFPEHTQRRTCEERFTVPGLARIKPEPDDNATLRGAKAFAKPVRPFSLIGLQFAGEHQYKGTPSTIFFFKDFRFTNLSSENSRLYYQFRDQERFGELDPLPSLTLAHMGKWYGRRFEMSWDVRDSFGGNPFLAEGRTFDIIPEDSGGEGKKPLHIQLAQKIEFPVTEKGTYWVRVKNRWTNNVKDPVPELVEEREFRLDIINGKERPDRKSVPSEARIANNFVRIAPERISLIYSMDEKFAVNILFWKPGDEVKDVACRITISVRTASSGDQLRTYDLVPAWEGDRPFSHTVDLSELPSGAYRIKASIIAGKKIFDEVERLVGKKAPATEDKAAEIPDSVPTWKEMLSRPKPMFHLTPMLPGDIPQNSPQAWDEHYKPFLDKAGDLSNEIELSFDWNTVEPLPGVYDWNFVDRFVDYAGAKGLTVQLWPSFRDLPEWIPGFYEKSSEGQIFGSRQAYLFHGGRPNYANAPEISSGILDFARNTAVRYRTHPAVHSYFFCFEHPGDAPYVGWYEGYADESINAFREDCRKKFKDVQELNAKWSTNCNSWDAVVPPSKDSISQYWLDWLLFKRRRIEGLLKGCVTSIRSADPKRLIDMYADGIDDFKWFHEQGCMSANGGSHDAMAMPDYAAFPMLGLPQRTEDHSPGNWTAYFPTQLDASVFAMMAGAGANAHCKAYVFTKNKFSDMQNPNVSLGRYKWFMPIWTELRNTELLQPIEVFILKDEASYLVRARTTYTGWWSDPWGLINLSQAQVPCAAGYGDMWENGKLLIVNSAMDNMRISLAERIVRYAENGGTVLMCADSGRNCIEDQDQDWMLLKMFGFAPPQAEIVKERKTVAIPSSGAIFAEASKPFTLRDIWDVRPSEVAETAAFFDGDQKRAAISWKPFGKGKVAVVWAQTIVPPLFSEENAKYAFLGDVARWAGVQPIAEVTDNRFWTNMLKSKDGKSFYGLVHVGSWQNTPSETVEGAVRWLRLPEASYKITELISWKDLGEWTSEKLAKEGIPVKLRPREVAIYRMSKQ